MAKRNGNIVSDLPVAMTYSHKFHWRRAQNQTFHLKGPVQALFQGFFNAPARCYKGTGTPFHVGARFTQFFQSPDICHINCPGCRKSDFFL